jgi:hypothetical protein
VRALLGYADGYGFFFFFPCWYHWRGRWRCGELGFCFDEESFDVVV